MERLVTTTQAAQILGLSLQGIHYRIKKDQLKSIKQDGKTFVYISEYIEKQSNMNVEPSSTNLNDEKTTQSIIEVKDEQIGRPHGDRPEVVEDRVPHRGEHEGDEDGEAVEDEDGDAEDHLG